MRIHSISYSKERIYGISQQCTQTRFHFSFVSELKYLGVFIVRSHVFIFSLVYAKRSFHRAVIVYLESF